MISTDKRDQKIKKQTERQIEEKDTLKFNKNINDVLFFQHWSAMSSVAAYICTIDLEL